MYEKLNITENHLRVLSLFTAGFEREYYIREVQKLLKISPRTAQLALAYLENSNVLESKLKGKIRAYRLKKSYIAKGYLILTESYKKILFMENNLMIKEICEKITPWTKGTVVLFGSYVKGIQKKTSDLDIFVAGTYNKEKVDRISKLYGLTISIKNYPTKIFKSEINRDVLLREILDNHIVVSGSEEFIEAAVM